MLVRALGAEASRSGMMRPMMGRGRLQSPGSPGEPWTPLAGASRYVWIEYALGAFRTGRAVLFGGAGLLTLALGAGAALVARLAARNRELATRAARDRELVQLGEAARTLAHEIKNPLGVIRVQSALVRKRIKEGPAGAFEGLAIIDEETARLSDLADRIGAFLRGDEGVPETFAIGPFLADFSRRYGAACERGQALAAIGASVRADPERLRGILDNLVANALDAAAEAGAERAFTLEALPRKRSVELRVGDRGAGIPAGLGERVFEPFFTTKARGSGIGLALARRQTEGAGGSLRHEPREGGGTWFVVSLPRFGSAPGAPEAVPGGDGY
ncbi:MAG TPA: HAMP domain-containing sensor histidine kinase [Spirochaetales bacterium]|nr:HAMP domain-containing sensor histidine kinase [Spirochaetales bacterium]